MKPFIVVVIAMNLIRIQAFLPLRSHPSLVSLRHLRNRSMPSFISLFGKVGFSKQEVDPGSVKGVAKYITTIEN